MDIIASASENWGLGIRGRLLFSIPEDMKFFRSMTMGKTVVMGRRTLESFPGGRPLKGRTNLVLTRDAAFQAEGVCVLRSLDEARDRLRGLGPDDVFVIGGESVYRLFLPYCRRAYITRMGIRPEADAFLPDFDALPGWRLADPGQELRSGEISYRFTRYENEAAAAL